MVKSTPLPPRIHLVCSICGRRGAYSRERYIELTGTDQGVTALIEFAKRVAKCPRAAKAHPMINEHCGIIHDLAAEGRPYIPTAETEKEPPPA